MPNGHLFDLAGSMQAAVRISIPGLTFAPAVAILRRMDPVPMLSIAIKVAVLVVCLWWLAAMGWAAAGMVTEDRDPTADGR